MADLRILTELLPLAFAGEAYSVRLQARGGTAPYTWSVQSGTLFTGMSLDSSTGELTAAASALLGTEVGDRTITFRVTDSLAATHDLEVTLTLRPANYRRATALMLDPRLERMLSIWDVGVATRAQITAHFAQGPKFTSITPAGTFKEDVCVHYADQICYGQTPASPASPGASPGQTVWDKIQELDGGGKVLAEPKIITVSAYSSTEINTSPQEVVGFGPDDDLLGEGLGVRVVGMDEGPVYGSPENTLGYFALGQRFTLPAEASPSSVTLYLNRFSSPASPGNLTVGLSLASPGNIQIPAGSSYAAFGDGSAVVASGTLSLATVSSDASRTSWTSAHAYDIPLTLQSPFTGLDANRNYYLTIAADFAGSPFLEIAASVDDVTSLVAGSEAIALTTAFATSSPYYSPTSAASPALKAPFELATSPQNVTGLAFGLNAGWTGATVGIVTLAEVDPYSGSPATNDRYWVGESTATAADVRAMAFQLIDGYDRTGSSPVLDKTNFNEYVDAYGNQASIVEAQTTAGAEINPSGGGQTDADGFLSSGGAKLRVQLLPNSRGTVPELPFRVLAGSRRLLSNLGADSLIRTANKTGSTDAEVLAALNLTSASNPLLSLSQTLKPDSSGNLELTVNSGALAWNLNPGSYTAELQFNAQLRAAALGSPSGSVDFDSNGVLTLDAADSTITLTPVPGSNKIQIAAQVGITTLNTVDPDGSGNLTLVADEDSSHAGQTFITVSAGSAPNTVEIGTAIPDATTSLAGLLSTTDKQRLDALYAGSDDVTTAGTGALAGGHAHEATALNLGRTLTGYSTLLSSMNIADALEALNMVLYAQFSPASEAPNLATATTSFSAFATGYLADDSSTIDYSSPGYAAGDLVTTLVESTAATVFTVTSAPFGNPGNSGTVKAQLYDSPGATSPWVTLDTIDLDQTYSNSLSAIGGSPPNYTSVASHMQANPLNEAGSPTTKISFQAVSYSGLSTAGAPVFQLQVKTTPVLSDMQNALGYNQVRLFQDTGATTHASTAVTLVKDNYQGVSDPIINQSDLVPLSSVTPVWVSGVPHYAAATDPAFRVDADSLFDIAYIQQPVRVWDTADSPTEITFNYYDAAAASPSDATWIPSPSTPFRLGVVGEPYAVTAEDMTFLVGTDEVSSRLLTLEVSDPHGVQASQAFAYFDAASSPGRLMHLGRGGLSSGNLTTEYFTNEKYRLDINDYAGVDFASPVASPSFTSITVQPSGNGTTDADTYGWPNEYALTTFSATNTWNATTGSPSAEFRSGVSVTYAAGTLSSLPAAVTDLGLVHPGYCSLYNFDENLYAPAAASPYNTYAAHSSPLGYYDAYSAQGSVVYHRLFQSSTATNQGRLRIYGYKRGTASPTPTVLSYENVGSPITLSDFTGSFLNVGPASSPTPTMSGISLEVKFPSATKTPKDNPGATGWLDMLTTPGSSLYALGEDGYGCADTSVHSPGMVQGAGYVDVYWRSGSFTTGLSSNQAVVRVGIHDKEWVITNMQMLNQSTDTPWTNGA